MSGSGPGGKIIAAFASLFIAGLGQLLQGRVAMAALQFILWGVLWIFMAGWIITIWSVIDAALYKGDHQW